MPTQSVAYEVPKAATDQMTRQKAQGGVDSYEDRLRNIAAANIDNNMGLIN